MAQDKLPQFRIIDTLPGMKVFEQTEIIGTEFEEVSWINPCSPIV